MGSILVDWCVNSYRSLNDVDKFFQGKQLLKGWQDYQRISFKQSQLVHRLFKPICSINSDQSGVGYRKSGWNRKQLCKFQWKQDKHQLLCTWPAAYSYGMLGSLIQATNSNDKTININATSRVWVWDPAWGMKNSGLKTGSGNDTISITADAGIENNWRTELTGEMQISIHTDWNPAISIQVQETTT